MTSSRTGEVRAPPNTPRLRRNKTLWVGWTLSGLMAALLTMDGAIKLVPLRPVLETAEALGWPTDAGTWRGLGCLLLGATLLYLLPRTSLVGAILLTAYLGGAIATHARIGSPLFTHTLFGVYLGLLLWLGLWLRDPALRTLVR